MEFNIHKTHIESNVKYLSCECRSIVS